MLGFAAGQTQPETAKQKGGRPQRCDNVWGLLYLRLPAVQLRIREAAGRLTSSQAASAQAPPSRWGFGIFTPTLKAPLL